VAVDPPIDSNRKERGNWCKGPTSVATNRVNASPEFGVVDAGRLVAKVGGQLEVPQGRFATAVCLRGDVVGGAGVSSENSGSVHG
jgi:hypothetical protein